MTNSTREAKLEDCELKVTALCQLCLSDIAFTPDLIFDYYGNSNILVIHKEQYKKF